MVAEHANLRSKIGLTERLKGLGRTCLLLRRAPAEFQRNLVDWSRGGPRPRGWTRTGPPIKPPECTLGWVRPRLVDADECFAKNRAEMARWHVAFLQTYLCGGDLRATAYWLEYLVLRFGHDGAERMSARFIDLYESMVSGGWRLGTYVWLADLASARGLEAHFGFRYFRFDGAHRLSCLYMLGIRRVPCLVFSVRNKT